MPPGPYPANKVLFLHTAFPVLSLTAAHLGVCAMFTRVALALGRGLHSSTLQLNLSASV